MTETYEYMYQIHRYIVDSIPNSVVIERMDNDISGKYILMKVIIRATGERPKERLSKTKANIAEIEGLAVIDSLPDFTKDDYELTITIQANTKRLQ